mmetsp:Transcript_8833/g.22520  ORF Transcript_8833/g.22520 Transcript_8833/m.22520 type:complete len:203 (-) Transcript_8833:1288-1896(-)
MCCATANRACSCSIPPSSGRRSAGLRARWGSSCPACASLSLVMRRPPARPPTRLRLQVPPWLGRMTEMVRQARICRTVRLSRTTPTSLSSGRGCWTRATAAARAPLSAAQTRTSCVPLSTPPEPRASPRASLSPTGTCYTTSWPAGTSVAYAQEIAQPPSFRGAMRLAQRLTFTSCWHTARTSTSSQTQKLSPQRRCPSDHM